MNSDKVVFITGAASGIGYALAEAFAESGAKVIVSDLNEDGVKQASQYLLDQGYDCLGIKCDVTDESELEHAINVAFENHGRIDVLINNAGLQHVDAIEDFPTEKFERLVNVMQIAPFMATKYVFPIMKSQGWGRIINMSSINGLVGFAGKAGYNSAKHGLIGLTKVAALEGAEHGITVNAICPGYMDTPLVRNQLDDLAENRNVTVEKVMEDVIYPLVPQKRLIELQEVTDYTMFIASDKGKGVTGQAIVIDGGYTAQ